MRDRKKSDRVQVKVNMREHLRSRLEAAAADHDVSMSAEIVNRLETTFQAASFMDQLRTLFGGQGTLDIALTVARVMHQAGVDTILNDAPWHIDHSDSSKAPPGYFSYDDITNAWRRHPLAYDRAVKAAITTLEQMRPTEASKP